MSLTGLLLSFPVIVFVLLFVEPSFVMCCAQEMFYVLLRNHDSAAAYLSYIQVSRHYVNVDHTWHLRTLSLVCFDILSTMKLNVVCYCL